MSLFGIATEFFITSATAISVLCTEVHWYDISLKMCIDFLSSNIGSLLILVDLRETSAYTALSSDDITSSSVAVCFSNHTLKKQGHQTVQMLSLLPSAVLLMETLVWDPGTKKDFLDVEDSIEQPVSASSCALLTETTQQCATAL